MDDTLSDPTLLGRTLNQFSLINLLFSRMRGLVRQFILDDIIASGPHREGTPISVLDVGAGACDIPLWLLAEARKKGLHLEITCLDHDPRVADYARRRTAREPAITIQEGSALEISQPFDYIMANHLLHHLTETDIALFLDRSYQACRRRLLLNDLLRSYWSLAGFSLFGALFLHRSFARADGTLSIRRGFRPDELKQLLDHSPWRSASTGQGTPHPLTLLGRRIPGRVFLVADRRSCGGPSPIPRTTIPRTTTVPGQRQDPCADERGDSPQPRVPR
ncbi:Methyltransferase domain-containing protein [Alkalispirochaeta americana]|uniref:Methyltransferase domain-containing protein n=2 Tax=Alkalispirochaeta americana TaxID=159291 RepID=A0A1N6RHI1_9SPIO|nr:Methyltransferase domain-containing protein [Alkalispirochaeta americana]